MEPGNNKSVFKLKSGNKPSMAKLAGVSPMKKEKLSFKQQYQQAIKTPADKRSDMQKEIIKRYKKNNPTQDDPRFRGNYDEVD